MNREFKLLIVDDDSSAIMLITKLIENENYELLAALNGETAIEIAQKTKPDLILLDWEMPGLNGIETLRRLKVLPSTMHIPVIMITGRINSMEDLKIAFDAGAIDFVHKPVEAVELVARIRSMLFFADYYQQSLRQKDWELTLIIKDYEQNVSLFERIIEPLEAIRGKLRPECEKERQTLDSVIKELKSNIKVKSWEEFNEQFKKVHPNFGNNLIRECPSLTKEEIRLCHLLRMNMNSKEIAALTMKNPASVDIARYRIRKKINLDRNESLFNFLSRL
jgi:response regulator RpfG family c-di-GMP phosphodiesterase